LGKKTRGNQPNPLLEKPKGAQKPFKGKEGKGPAQSPEFKKKPGKTQRKIMEPLNGKKPKPQ